LSLLYKYITISGTIGAGKTELARIISERCQSKLILEEFTNNTFLEKFYENPERYGFPLEISFLFERFQQLKVEFANSDLFKQSFVSDYIFDQCLLFARNNLKDDQYNVFKTLYYPFYEQLPKPDLLVYLHREVKHLLSNIRKRGRDFEQNIQYKYLNDLQEAYLNYFRFKQDQRILVLKLSDLDFMSDDKLCNKIIDLINKDYNFGMKFIELK
jgi:deoxyadenosine/deoxycytidine kinase